MHILVDIGGCELDLTVQADADLDGTYEATCNDTGERLCVNGWLADDTIIVAELEA